MIKVFLILILIIISLFLLFQFILIFYIYILGNFIILTFNKGSKFILYYLIFGKLSTKF